MDSYIRVRGARQNNLKSIDLDIPRDQLVVMTGLSGSGKSSLAFDTLYAEGQRRYVESLSSYARQFLGQMDKPDVDLIEGLSPAISIDQKTTSHNPRSTVGTVTEIYDFLRLLYARVGRPHCPQCGKPIVNLTVDQIVDQIMEYPERSRIYILAPVVRGRKGSYKKLLEELRSNGYLRVRINREFHELDDLVELNPRQTHTIEVVVDRLIVRDDIRSRLADSVQTALGLADDLMTLTVEEIDEEGESTYIDRIMSQNNACPDCNISLGEISPQMFSFNNPYGACPECSGLGFFQYVDPRLVIDDPTLSINDGAIHAGGWNFHDPKSWGRSFIEAMAKTYKFSLDVPYEDLSDDVKHMILYGTPDKMAVDTSNSRYTRRKNYKSAFEGLIPSIERRHRESSNEDIRSFYSQYMSEQPCSACHGARLRPEPLAVLYGGKNIFELTELPLRKTVTFLSESKEDLTRMEAEIAAQILQELKGRIQFLVDVGLDYMTLSRASSTLSGGEAQRIRLATQIGSGLMGVIYILDEPSIGLHQRDNARLLTTLKHLRDLGNSVLVVEHDEETMREADCIVDIGPGAGDLGGEVVAIGNAEEIMSVDRSITGQYLSGKRSIHIPEERRNGNGNTLQVRKANLNNLKNLGVDIPLGQFVCVTGVSGSGKSSLVNGIILPHLEHRLNRAKRATTDQSATVEGIESLDKVIAIDQSPIGRTPRSNPATYTGVFDSIRKLYSETILSKQRGYKPGRFSFNVKGGRCEACKGDGVNRIEMHFLPDVYVACDVCHGKRYNRETLEVTYRDKNIAEVLNMRVTEALKFFEHMPAIQRRLQTIEDVGLGYIRLGQPSTQLSGGEAQRVKLATELARRATGQTFYILDEPTTGLHAYDVERLVEVLQRLTDQGNSVLVIEHNLDVIKVADHIIDLGPEGGEEGGTLIAQGSPEEVSRVAESYTGQYLAKVLAEKVGT